MGTFVVQIEVGGIDGERFEVVEALVDTGATTTVIPGSILGSLGIVPDQAGDFRVRQWTAG